MNFITHNDAEIDTVGASLHGYIQATYEELVNAFGAPQLLDCEKVTMRWQLRFGDMVATIYDWKRGDLPIANEIIGWHVGARDSQAVLLVHDAFRERKGFRIRSAA